MQFSNLPPFRGKKDVYSNAVSLTASNDLFSVIIDFWSPGLTNFLSILDYFTDLSFFDTELSSDFLAKARLLSVSFS